MTTLTKQVKVSKIQAWFLAARPRTLTIACLPVLLGTILVAQAGVGLSWLIALCTLLVALTVQMGTNFINDALDFKKGADTAQRIGPVRATQSGLLSIYTVWWSGMILFGCTLLFGLPLVWQGGWPIALLLILSVTCGYLYTGGPAPLAYVGLGECFVLLFFGLASTIATYYLQTGNVAPQVVLAGTQIGLLAMLVIALNNLRDRSEDTHANKRTLAVRFGLRFARLEITFLALVPFVLNLLWLNFDYAMAALLPWLSLPLALLIVYRIWTTPPGAIYNLFFRRSALLHLLFGLLLAGGLWLS